MDKIGYILRRNQRFLRNLHAISVFGGLGSNNVVRGDEMDSDSETIRNESDTADSDSDTIPYDIEEKIRSRAGREIRIKVPLDYDDL